MTIRSLIAITATAALQSSRSRLASYTARRSVSHIGRPLLKLAAPTASKWGFAATARRYNTVKQEEDMIVEFDEIRRIIKSEATGVRIIDVREPNELEKGYIPSAENVPLSKFMTAWAASPENFQDEFGFEKPSHMDEIIVYCQAGIRSAQAANYLRELGYKTVRNYRGSYADYAERILKE